MDMLRFMRAKYNVSQRIVAEAADYDKSFISRLESGDRKPSREVVLILAEAMGLTPDDTDKLLLSANFMPVQPTAMLANPELARLDDLMAAASADKREWAKNAVSDVIAVLRLGVKEPNAAPA
jgi:transcriptional regulator with XRE-family HTH domain